MLQSNCGEQLVIATKILFCKRTLMQTFLFQVKSTDMQSTKPKWGEEVVKVVFVSFYERIVVNPLKFNTPNTIAFCIFEFTISTSPANRTQMDPVRFIYS